MNWRGRPLVNYEAVLDATDYHTGVPVADEDFAAIRVPGPSLHPDWNYTISPHVQP